MIFVSYYDSRLDLNVWRACSAIRRVGMNLARLVIFLHGGQLDIAHQYPLYLGMLGGAGLGLLLGNILNARWNVNAKKLHWFIVSLMIYGGVLLAVSGSSSTVEQYTTGLIVTCALVSIIVAGSLQCYTRRTDRRNSGTDQHERLIDKYSSLTVTSTPVRAHASMSCTAVDIHLSCENVPRKEKGCLFVRACTPDYTSACCVWTVLRCR